MYWNGTIRIFMEGYIDLTLFAMLNINEIFWNEDIKAVSVCNWISIIILGLSMAMPLIMLIYIACRRSKLHTALF